MLCVQVQYRGQRAWAKVFNDHIEPSTQLAKQELSAYQTLHDCAAIPRLLAHGVLQGTPYSTLVLQDCGEELVLVEGRVPQHLRDAVQAAIQSLHEAGWVHGDLHPRNMVQCEGVIKIVNLEDSRIGDDRARRTELRRFAGSFW